MGEGSMLDITQILAGWEYNPNEINVRIIKGADQKLKVQMRLDLGLLQMEYEGRPDGKRPHGFESLFEYYKNKLRKHRAVYGTVTGFLLDSDDCEALQMESLQYYYRYLSLFHLQEYQAVERDTERNLKVFDFIRRYAEEDEDQVLLEQYRPYVIMMNTRAKAHQLIDQNRPEQAVAIVQGGIHRIETFLNEFKDTGLVDHCSELIFLKEFVDEIRHRQTIDPIQDLRDRMNDAVSREDYETAAILRDQIKKLTIGAE